MTIKKALEMIQNLRNCELKTLEIFVDEDDLDSKIRRIAKGKAIYLKHILHEIRPKLFPCKHPKQIQDIDPDGNRYCTGCNQNL